MRSQQVVRKSRLLFVRSVGDASLHLSHVFIALLHADRLEVFGCRFRLLFGVFRVVAVTVAGK